MNDKFNEMCRSITNCGSSIVIFEFPHDACLEDIDLVEETFILQIKSWRRWNKKSIDLDVEFMLANQ